MSSLPFGALVYGYVGTFDEIIIMPQVETYVDNGRHIIQIDMEDVTPIEWAMGHHKYGDYVFAEDDTGWHSDKVVFGVMIGISGDELDIEDMINVKRYAPHISEVVKFFCDRYTDISDYGYHLITIYS